MFSLLERVLLSVIQYRQGPVSSSLHGILHVISDGVKLYSKFSLDLFSWSSGVFILGLSLCILVGITMSIHSCGALAVHAQDFDGLFFISLLGIVGLLTLLPFSITPSRFVSLGSIRHLKASILADIVLESSFLVLFPCLLIIDSSADHCLSRSISFLFCICLFCIVFPILLLSSGKAPFDLPEAESELVSGNLTDFGGIAFSLCLLADYTELLVWLIFFSTLCFTLYLTAMVLVFFILISHIGRILLVRVHIQDIPRIVFLVLL